MRYITLGGKQYPIHCSVVVDAAICQRRNRLLMDIEDATIAEAQENNIPDSKLDALISRRKREALRDISGNAEETLIMLSDMINAAVDYQQVICGRDIRSEIEGGYPMTAKKLAFIASVSDLNSETTMDTVAQEIIEAQGGDAKNLSAGRVVQTARALQRQIFGRSARTGPGSNTSAVQKRATE